MDNQNTSVKKRHKEKWLATFVAIIGIVMGFSFISPPHLSSDLVHSPENRTECPIRGQVGFQSASKIIDPVERFKTFQCLYGFTGRLFYPADLAKAEAVSLADAWPGCPAGIRPCAFAAMLEALTEISNVNTHDAFASDLSHWLVMENKMADANRVDLLIKNRNVAVCHGDVCMGVGATEYFDAARVACYRETTSLDGESFDSCIDAELQYKECGSPVHCDFKAGRHEYVLSQLPTELERRRYLENLSNVMKFENKMDDYHRVASKYKR